MVFQSLTSVSEHLADAFDVISPPREVLIVGLDKDKSVFHHNDFASSLTFSLSNTPCKRWLELFYGFGAGDKYGQIIIEEDLLKISDTKIKVDDIQDCIDELKEIIEKSNKIVMSEWKKRRDSKDEFNQKIENLKF